MADVNRYKLYSNVNGAYSDKNFSAISFNANVMNNILHGLNFKALNNYDIFTMEEKSSTNHNLSVETGSMVQISKDGKVAIDDYDGYVHIYSDYSLKNKIVQLKAGKYPFKFIGNSKILIEEI